MPQQNSWRIVCSFVFLRLFYVSLNIQVSLTTNNPGTHFAKKTRNAFGNGLLGVSRRHANCLKSHWHWMLKIVGLSDYFDQQVGKASVLIFKQNARFVLDDRVSTCCLQRRPPLSSVSNLNTRTSRAINQMLCSRSGLLVPVPHVSHMKRLSHLRGS